MKAPGGESRHLATDNPSGTEIDLVTVVEFVVVPFGIEILEIALGPGKCVGAAQGYAPGLIVGVDF